MLMLYSASQLQENLLLISCIGVKVDSDSDKLMWTFFFNLYMSVLLKKNIV